MGTSAHDVRSPRWFELGLAQILVGFVDPVLARWIEDIQIDGVHKCFRFVRHMRRNRQYLARVDHDLLAVDPELQGTFQDVSELLVVMAVLRNNASSFKQDPGQHDVPAYDELALQ